MFQVFLTTFVSFFITVLSIPVILKEAERKKLYDIPDEKKLHIRPIASLGGLGILAGFLLASVMSIKGYLNPEFQYIYAAVLLVFFLGLKNDLIDLSIRNKILGQLIAAAILIHFGGFHIHNFFGLFGVWELNQAVGFTLSYFVIIIIVNSFNLIDRVDGLAAGLGILTMLVFGLYFYFVGQKAYALLSCALSGSLLAFLIFNRPPAKIFMGNAGSMMIGLINAILVIKFINVANTPGIRFPLPSTIALGIAILIVPLLDTMRVFILWLFYGRSIFSKDRNHLHHLLVNMGFKHIAITITCICVNIGFIALAWFGRSLGPNKLLLLLVIAAFTVLGLVFYIKWRYIGNMQKRIDAAKEINPST